MAVDTQDKRASAIYVGLPWRMSLPQSNADIDQGDRQQVALLYRGIAADAPSEESCPTAICLTGVGQ